MTKQTLALVATHTATAYRFQTTGPGFTSWAICTINDSTGELLITSDWGNWSYRWNASPRALGAPNLTAFIAGVSGVDYLAHKLQGNRGGRRFSAEKTVAAWRRTLCEQRLEVGHRVGHPLTRALAREIWDALGDAADECGDSVDLFLARVYEIDGFTDHVDERPHESLESKQTAEDRALREMILPALRRLRDFVEESIDEEIASATTADRANVQGGGLPAPTVLLNVYEAASAWRDMVHWTDTKPEEARLIAEVDRARLLGPTTTAAKLRARLSAMTPAEKDAALRRLRDFLDEGIDEESEAATTTDCADVQGGGLPALAPARPPLDPAHVPVLRGMLAREQDIARRVRVQSGDPEFPAIDAEAEARIAALEAVLSEEVKP